MFARVTFDDVGFAAPLMGGSEDRRGGGGWDMLPWAEAQQLAASCWKWWHVGGNGELVYKWWFR